MPIYKVEGPDGRIYKVEGPAGASEAEILRYVETEVAPALAAQEAEKPKKKTGIGAALGKGVESLISSGRTGISALMGSPEDAARAGLARGEDMGQRYEDQVSLEKVQQAYRERGFLPAAGEAISQIPAAIAEQVPNIGATLASARAGQAAGAAFGPMGRVVGGLGGAALPGLVQMFGSNIERQAAEQQEAGRPISIDRTAAAAAALPQAALDVAGTFIPLGGRLVSKLTGIPAEALLGKSAAQAAKLADERLLATLIKGTAVGAVAEIPTEIAQQMLERAQAGLSLTSPDALAEYGETAYQVGLLAPIGAAGRIGDRSAARGQVRQKEEEARQEAALQALQEEEQLEAQAALAKEQAAIAEEARKTGTPELLAQMGDQTVAGKYSALPDAERARTEKVVQLAKNMGYTDADIDTMSTEDLLAMVRNRTQTDLAQMGRVIPDLQAQINTALQANNRETLLQVAKGAGYSDAELATTPTEALSQIALGRVAELSRQLKQLTPAEESLKSVQKEIAKLQPKEADPDAVKRALQKAIDNGDFDKAETLAQELQKLQKEQGAAAPKIPSPTSARAIQAIPTEQTDMFGAPYQRQLDVAEQKQEQQDTEQITEMQPAEQAQTAEDDLFAQTEAIDEARVEKDLGKQFELTPEQYADALRKGTAPEEAPAPKVLYRQVPISGTTGPTKRVAYVVDEKGVSKDLSEKEVAALQEQPTLAKSSVDEAIDTGVINKDVRAFIGLSGLGNRNIDLTDPQQSQLVEQKLRSTLAERKKQAQDLLDTFIKNEYAEDALYDAQGKLTPEARDIIRRDVQTQELERLLQHIVRTREERGAATKEEATAEKLAAAPQRGVTVSTALPPLESITPEETSELAQAFGLPNKEALLGAVKAGTTQQDKISAVRHRIEARRQAAIKKETYDKLLETLEDIKQAKDKGQTPFKGQQLSRDVIATNKAKGEAGSEAAKPKSHKYDLQKLSKLRAQYVQAALLEAAHTRAAQGQPQISAAQVLDATSKLQTALKELSERYIAKRETETVVGLKLLGGDLYRKIKDMPEGKERDAAQKALNAMLAQANDPLRNRIAALQKEAQRLRGGMEQYQAQFVEPLRQAYLAMPQGPKREAAEQKYLQQKKGLDIFSDNDSKVTDEIVRLLQRLTADKVVTAEYEKDIRPLAQRPFASPQRALEVIKSDLDKVSEQLLVSPLPKRVEVPALNRADNLLKDIREKQARLDSIKSKQGAGDERDSLTKQIESLKDRYNKMQAAEVEERPVPTSFKERRAEAAELEAKIKEAFAAKDYATTATLLKRMNALNLGEKAANEFGSELEDTQKALERAIADTRKQIDDIAKTDVVTTVKLGDKVPPRRGFTGEQAAQLRVLNKQLDALENALVEARAAQADMGLFVGSIDTQTGELFAPTEEQGTIFETADKFLKSATYGKIAKLRKQVKEVENTLPVSITEVQQARTDYVVALTSLQNLRKQLGTRTAFNYYAELAGQYGLQADAMAKKKAEAAASKNKLERARWTAFDAEAKRLGALSDAFQKMADNASLLDISKYSPDVQALVAQAKVAGQDVKGEERDIAVAMAQKNVDTLKKAMDAVDERARKHGVTYPAKETQAAAETKADSIDTQIGAINTQIKQVREQMAQQAPDMRATSQYEIQKLIDQREELEGMKFLATAEGRIKALTESFMEEYSVDYDPSEPYKNAFSRAKLRSREYIPATAAQDAEKLETLLKSRKEVLAALDQYKAIAPSDDAVAKDLWGSLKHGTARIEIAKLEFDLYKLDGHIDFLRSNIEAAQDAEVEMLRRSDSILKDAWAKLKKAEADLAFNDTKKSADLAKRRGALLRTQQVLDDAKQDLRDRERAQQARIENGLGLPGIKVTRVKALSKEGLAAAEVSGTYGTGRKVQTMNAGWSVRYTNDGPVFDYDPKLDPEADPATKAQKSLDATKAYDRLKKARSAYNRALREDDPAKLEVARRNLDRNNKLMENLAGARYVSVKEVLGTAPTELDAKLVAAQDLKSLSPADAKKYFEARAEQERLRKEIEHVRTLKGQTEISQQRTAVRNAQDQYEKISYALSEVKREWEYDISPLSESAYNRRVKDLTQQLDQAKAKVDELSTRLKPMEVKNEQRLNTLTTEYFAAKNIADKLVLGEPVTETKGATRAPLAENVKDLAQATRTLAQQENATDVRPLTKQNQQLKTASPAEQRAYNKAEKLAKMDRIVTMHPEGSPEYTSALKEVTKGYVNKLAEAKGSGTDVVLRVEEGTNIVPMDAKAAQDAATAFAAKLPKDVKFVYAPTMRQAPVKFLKALAESDIDVATSTVKGGVLGDGTIVVIGDMHSSLKDLEQTFVHEAVGHYGVDIVLGPQGMLDLTKAIRTADGGIYGMAEALGVEKDVAYTAMAWESKAILAEQRGDAEQAAKLRRMGEVQSVREILAHLQERTVDESLISKAGRYIRTLLGAIRNVLKNMGLLNTASISSNDLYYTLFQATRKMQQELAGAYESPTGLLSLRANYASPELAAAAAVVDNVVAKERNLYDRIKANGSGLAFETQMVDRFAGFERLAKTMPSLRGTQMMFYLRMYDQRMNLVAQSVGNGALQRIEKTRPDGQKEYIIESVKGPSPRSVAEILKQAAPLVGSPDGASRLFTLYLANIRAKNKGLDTLSMSSKVSQSQLNQAMTAINNTPGLADLFNKARLEYNAYNKNLVRFAGQTGALSQQTITNLLKDEDYVPYYRQRNGVVELLIGSEAPIRIGSIAEQPYLQELVGGDAPILDFMTSVVQNTNLLTDMSLRNLATKNAVFELVDMGLAKITKKVMTGSNVVKFKMEPENDKDTGDRYAMINTDKAGIPADVLVKGMEGIPTQFPFVVRALGVPATFLRRAITLSPLYAARQLFRDSLAAPLMTGANFTPVMGALREIGSATKGTLETRGITGGQVFTGGPEDLTKILRDVTSGRGVWTELVGKAEALSMEADALTRRAQYNSYIKQGLSEMEATYMALESMNFNKRGASPSVHWINSMVPFFNAQIQGLNVLYKAMSGNLPFNERLKIQEKLLTRGLMIAAGTLAYTAYMQDDEAYKNATPEQKYGNWFVRIPGVEEPLRIPIPFEIGYIFKALPEALYNSLMTDAGSEEAVKAFNQILIQTIPGGTSMATVDFGGVKIPTLLPIPAAAKPIIETSLGKSFFTQRDILSRYEQTLLPEAQYRENSTEIAKMFGAAVGASPIKIEALIQGYTGTMGLAFLQAISTPFSSEGSPEKTFKRLSEMPLVGSAFQPNDAGGIINSAYEKLDKFSKVADTINSYVERGEIAKAKELMETRSEEYLLSEVSSDFTSQMRELSQYERAIRASALTPEEKRAQLDEVRKTKIALSEMVREAVRRRELQ